MSSVPSGGTTQAVEPPLTPVSTDVPVQTRSDRFQSVNPSDFPEVTGREPDWKLTPVTKLRPLIDGDLDGSRYDIAHNDVQGISVTWEPSDATERGVAGLAEDRAAANAWSSTKEVLVIDVRGEPEEQFTLTRENLGLGARAAHTIIRVHPNTHATITFLSYGDALLGENVEFDLRDGASLQAVFVQDWNPGSLQFSHHRATLAKDASLTHVSVSLGGDVVVVNPSVQLVGSGSEAHLFGAYFADATQHLEHRVYVHHQGPKTVSRVAYKGALHGAGARTVWIGDVLIGQDALGTDSYEQNRNLVLSEGTRADSIPNLEIKTGDIQGAGHASATGRFDDEQLFYLQSRGIEELDARRLVVMGFLLEIVQKITDPDLASQLTTKLRNKLSRTEDAR